MAISAGTFTATVHPVTAETWVARRMTLPEASFRLVTPFVAGTGGAGSAVGVSAKLEISLPRRSNSELLQPSSSACSRRIFVRWLTGRPYIRM